MKVWFLLVRSGATNRCRVVRECGVTSLHAILRARAGRKLMPRDSVLRWTDDVSLHLGA